MAATTQPGGRAAAPGTLAVVQDFVNTADLEGGVDELSEANFGQWAEAWGVAATADVRDQVVGLREALRDWIASGAEAIPDEVAERLPPLELGFGVVGGRLQVTADSTLGRALAPVIDAIRTALDDGTWSRLKACDRSRCRWVFYDHSKNAASHWCATSICGAREKARRAYARRADKVSHISAS
jgi:predicted RNA-binding Zn ribbon-like protein